MRDTGSLAIGYGAQAVEHQEGLLELCINLPEKRAHFALRRVAIARSGWTLTAGLTRL